MQPWHAPSMQGSAACDGACAMHMLRMAVQAAGAAVLEELQRQRETLQRSKKTMEDVNGDVTKSNSILKGMNWRAKFGF